MSTTNTVDQVGATTFTTPTDREVVVTRAFAAPREVVFDAWTKPEHLRRWMLGPPGWTMPVCEVDLRPGGEHRSVWRRATPGNDDPGCGTTGSEIEIREQYREIERPHRLVTTETWGGDWAETLNTMTLTEQAGTTLMACTILYPSKDARDAALKTGMKDGMAVSFDRLDELLRTIA